MAVMLTVAIPAMGITSVAQTRSCNSNNRQYRETSNSYSNDGYYSNEGYGYEDVQYRNGQPNVYDRHRKAINIGSGAAAGAILGAIFGGRKGALIGAAVGAAGGAVVTSKQRPRNYYRPY